MPPAKKSKKKSSRTKESRQGRKGSVSPSLPRWIREVIGIALLGSAIFLVLSLLTYSPATDPGLFHQVSPKPQAVKNLGGPVGSYSASFLKEILGLGAYFVCGLIVWMAYLVTFGRKVRMAPWKMFLGFLALIWTSALLSLMLPDLPSQEQGGIVGQQIAQWLMEYLHFVGSFLVLCLLLLLSILAIGEIALLGHLKAFALLTARLAVSLSGILYRSARNIALGTSRISRQAYQLVRKSSSAGMEFIISQGRTIISRLSQLIRRWRKQDETSPLDPQEASSKPEIQNQPLFEDPTAAPPASLDPSMPQPMIVDTPAENGKSPDSDETSQGQIKKPRKPRQAVLPFPDPLPLGYRPPPLELFDLPDPTQVPVDTDGLYESATVLEQKLRDFGIEGKVTEIHPGPIITLFEYAPAPGIKVNRIVNLSDDLALAMKALSVRIVAPIPGKAVVGIEVPNTSRQMVYLRDVLASETYRSERWKLPLALGKDIAGKPVTTDLSRMPHLLIAGATGTGKSVCLHSLILSLLFRFSPRDVKFLFIDPKMLELSAYHGIPHLMHPVVTDAKRAQDILDWAVERMEQRYQLLSEKGVRNIDKYNERIEKEQASKGRDTDEEDESEAFQDEGADDLDDGFLPERGKLPYIILVIDEMADLMIVSGRQIEESITRLAQMARAAGIHLLLATQRPSVDVLTGIIKANLPTRISFQVSSRTDSRTILDSMGAEKLLGRGDMLFLPPGTSKIRRIHGAYVTEPEIERVVDYLKQFGKPRYEKIPFRAKKSGKKSKDEGEVFEEDEKYDLAVQLVTDSRQASISMIQRKLRVGYNRAARMIERMEEEGIVGPQEGVKPREVLANTLE